MIKNIFLIVSILIVILAGALFFTGEEKGTAPDEMIACTQEALQCPDGSYVSRVAPSCEFAPCPTENTVEPTAPQSGTNEANEVVITYTDSGFSPQTVSINKGDTVTFVNRSSGPMWPASAPHPSHSIYPEFDSKARLNAGQTYSFTFDRVGEWKFHNHSSAAYTGTVIVK